MHLRASSFLLVALAATSCRAEHDANAAAPSAQPGPKLAVRTAVATTGEVPTWLPLTGQLRGNRETELAANTNGRVTATHVERGARVKAGQILATVDVRAAALSAKEADIALKNARVASEASQRECERSRQLFASGAISKQEAERLEAQCQGSELTIAAAQTRSAMASQGVGDGTIRAPFAGIVAERHVDVGEYVRADSPVVSLVDAASLRLELTIPEAHIAKAHEGATVRFAVKGYPDARFTGRLTFVSGSVRAATRDVVAEAVLDNAEGLLRSGMFAAVELQTGLQKVTVVPRTALAEREGKPVVFVVTAGRAEQRIVQSGEGPSAETAAILRGVKDGESVVLEPPAELRNGLAVE